MTTESRNAFLGFSLEMKSAITAAETTSGIEFQPEEAKSAIVNFANKGLIYINDRSRDREMEMSQAFARIEEVGGSRNLGITVL